MRFPTSSLLIIAITITPCTAQWERMFGQPDVSRINALALGDGTLYVGELHGGLFKSDDRAVSWETVWEPTPDDGTGTYPSVVRDIAVDPHDPGVLFASSGAGLHRSDDAGLTWRQLSTDSESYHISPDVQRAGVWYVESRLGLRRTMDNGKTWSA